MDPISLEVQQLVADRIVEGPKVHYQQFGAQFGFSDLLEPDLGNLDNQPAAASYDLNIADFMEDEFSETGSEPSDSGSMAPRKRRSCGSCSPGHEPVQKMAKSEFPHLLGDMDCLFLPEGEIDWPDLSLGDLATPDYEGQNSGSLTSEPDSVFEYCDHKARSADSTDGSEAFIVSGLESAGDSVQTAEYHFQRIQQHAKQAILALKRGCYERNKNIVTWAHDLKNKVVHELKKEAETAWEAEKDHERVTPKVAPKKGVLGSTKRVEQFRKNMRRWMIGAQTGVEWMVYARMEHLQAIAKFILGDALPADPASQTAVAESINLHLQQQLPTKFLDSQLAEPEPGKRYVIGPGLLPLLQAKHPRQIQTLAFTMPEDVDPAAVADWVQQLKALFPKKPAPKAKVASKARSV